MTETIYIYMYVCMRRRKKKTKFWYKTICMHVCTYVYELLMKS